MQLEKSVKEEKSKFVDSKVFIDNRKKITLTGVEKIISANETQIMGKVNKLSFVISGTDLTVSKLDVESGQMEASGNITGFKYTDGQVKGFFRRIFR